MSLEYRNAQHKFTLWQCDIMTWEISAAFESTEIGRQSCSYGKRRHIRHIKPSKPWQWLQWYCLKHTVTYSATPTGVFTVRDIQYSMCIHLQLVIGSITYNLHHPSIQQPFTLSGFRQNQKSGLVRSGSTCQPKCDHQVVVTDTGHRHWLCPFTGLCHELRPLSPQRSRSAAARGWGCGRC